MYKPAPSFKHFLHLVPNNCKNSSDRRKKKKKTSGHIGLSLNVPLTVNKGMPSDYLTRTVRWKSSFSISMYSFYRVHRWITNNSNQILCFPETQCCIKTELLIIVTIHECICRHTCDISASKPRQLSLLMCCDTSAPSPHTVSNSSDNPKSSVSNGHNVMCR